MTSRNVQGKPKRMAVLVLGAVAVMARSGAAWAEDPAVPAPAEPAKLERVEVTGSLIKRTIDGESSLPVTIIQTEDLTKAGVTTVEQLLTMLPGVQNAGSGAVNTSNNIGSSTGGQSTLSLRGLGPNYSLILVNGMRLANFAYAPGSGDVGGIPLGALDRVEILRDGASAVYGTDAIGGVVNFITKRNFQGFSAEADEGSPSRDGGRTTHFSATGGFGSLDTDKFNLLMSYNLQRQQSVTTLQRDFATRASSAGVSSNTFPANYSQGANIFANPVAPGCQPPIVVPAGDGATCQNASGLAFDLVPYSSSDGTYAKASFKLPGENVAGIEYFRTDHHVRTTISPDVHGGDTLPYASPYFPGKGITPITNPAAAGGTLDRTDLTLFWRLTPIGGRVDNDESVEDRLAATLKGTLLDDVDYSFAAFTTHSRVSQSLGTGYADDGIIQDLLSGTNGVYKPNSNDNPNGIFINPFGANTTQQIAAMGSAQIIAPLISAADFTRGANLTLSKPVMALAGGDMIVSGGGEFRHESFVYNVNDVVATATVNSTGIPPGSSVPESSRNSNAFYLEALAPFTKELEADLAVRMDHYDGFGSTTNPKLSLRFQPSQQLLFRGSAATGFRAPDLLQINQPNSVALTGGKYSDPILCPGGTVPAGLTGVNRLVSCKVQQNLLFGGNKDLKPEKSRQFTLGVVYQPFRGFKTSLDIWEVKIKDQVRQPGEGALYNNFGTFGSSYVRCSQANPAFLVSLKTQCPAGGSPNDNLAYVLDTYSNIGEINARGADLNVNYGLPSSVGKFEFTYDLSYISSYKYELYPGAGFVENTGVYSNDLNQVIFRFQHTAAAAWKQGDWSALVMNHFRSGYADSDPTHHVPQFWSWDTGVGYTGFKRLTLDFTIKNLMGRDPPYSNQSNTFQLGYDPYSGDPIGRVYFLSVRYDMK